MNKLKVVPFDKDTAPEVAQRTIPVVREALAPQGVNADSAAKVFLNMWARGQAKLIHQYNTDTGFVAGAGVLMISPSLLYPTDAVVVLFAPASGPGDGEEMIRFLENVAIANGAQGISMTLPSTPTSFAYIDALASDGWSAKSVIYGKGLQ